MYTRQPFQSKCPGLLLKVSEVVRVAVGLEPMVLHPVGLDLNQAPVIQPGANKSKRGCSSAGRAPDLHSGGRRFDPDQLHQLAYDPMLYAGSLGL